MRCFTHQDREAVALCRGCGRGVCSECAVDVGRGLACRGRCEQFARDFVAYLEEGVKTHKSGFGNVTVIQQSDPGIKLTSPTSPPQLNQYLTATITQHIASNWRFRFRSAIFHLIVGIVLLGWGIVERDRTLWPLVLGICFLLYAGFNLFRRGEAKAVTQTKEAKT